MVINDVKKNASDVSSAYLKNGSNMNDAILNIAVQNKLNDEIIKTLCAISNQNVYLSIFHSSPERRGNIVFDLADAEKVIKKIKENTMDSDDYMTAPIDFRLDQYEEPVEQEENQDEPEVLSAAKKADIINKLTYLTNAIKTMEFQENQEAESNILKTSSYCKGLVANGESFGDMSKLAMRYSKDNGFDMEKTAKLYSTIGTYLSKKGFNVPMELTKISSMKINDKSEAFSSLRDYHLNLIKISALKEMKDNITKVAAYLKSDKKTIGDAVK